MIRDEKSFAAGLFFLAIGSLFFYRTVTTLAVGDPFRMGAGFFPAMIGIGLIVTGILILCTMKGADRLEIRHWPWRAFIYVGGGILFFMFALRLLGFLPASVVLLYLAARAQRSTGHLKALVISLGVSLFCGAVFIWALGVPLRFVAWP